MVLGTFISAPIMFVSSKMILMMKSGRSGLDEDFNKALFDTGILSTVCCVSCIILNFVAQLDLKEVNKFIFISQDSNDNGMLIGHSCK